MDLVKDWYNDAKTNGAQTVHSYKKVLSHLINIWHVSYKSHASFLFQALRSLEKYPLRLETGADCRILYGFGDKICQLIDQKLNTNTRPPRTPATMTWQKTVSMSDLGNTQQPTAAIHLSDQDEEDDHPPPSKQPKRARVPKINSKTITKTASAGPKLFNPPTTSSTAPTTISTLLGIADSSVKSSNTPAQPVATLKPGSFHITLCIDNAEASRSTQKVLLDHLKKSSIEFDIRKLNIGDFLWTVRREWFLSRLYWPWSSWTFFPSANDKDTNVEAILDYIVERKRLDDLSKSIIDGRYNEQKVDSRWPRLLIDCLFTVVSFETMRHYEFNLSGGKSEEYQ